MAGAGADRFAFSRFGEKRNYNSSDVAGYDEYVEGVEAEETTSLDTPLQEDNRGFKLIQKMGWKSGTGLGKYQQGRVDPVPFELKDDHLGLGRWTMELELAQDATEKRRQMEIEKDITPDLVEQYKAQAEKDRKMAETIAEMRKSFYCDLCDKQYTKYSEYDNHLNSYDHHHRQRLKDLREYEIGRKFGGHRNLQEEKDKMMAAQIVAMERAQMTARRHFKAQGGFAPAFKPIGQSSTNQMTAQSHHSTTPSTAQSSGVKRSQESEESNAKIAEKKAKIAKFGLKFQSAGTLVTVNDGNKRMSLSSKGLSSSLSEDTGDVQSATRFEMLPHSQVAEEIEKKQYVVSTGGRGSSGRSNHEKSEPGSSEQGTQDGGSDQKFSFGFHKKQPTSSHGKTAGKNPPPLMSRQRELTMSRAFGDDEEDEETGLAQLPIRRPPRFKFNIGK